MTTRVLPSPGSAWSCAKSKSATTESYQSTPQKPHPSWASVRVRSRLTPFRQLYHQVHYCRRIDDILLPNVLPEPQTLYAQKPTGRQRLILDSGNRRNRHSAVELSAQGNPVCVVFLIIFHTCHRPIGLSAINKSIYLHVEPLLRGSIRPRAFPVSFFSPWTQGR